MAAYQAHYEKLKDNVAKYETVLDPLICKEVELTTMNDDMHFVFCDFVYQVLLPFFRDSSIRDVLGAENTISSSDLCYQTSDLEDTVDESILPPSGVVPFHGISLYASPLCYLYDDPIILFNIFKKLYTRYFYKLHNLCPHDEENILGLSVLFEKILLEMEPNLTHHFLSNGIQPIRLVFKWLFRAFSGYLTPDQVLHLWDRILGFDTLKVLPLLAVGILAFRKNNLYQVTTTSAAEVS
ncbi:hypothetical protein Ciccas_008352 [Cichlidogyrus casuarinus]|uniref:Rab-GAP TBC domain-containing protein n=1 Tax=Cichlidogyrus casuarinus TaxID=1844966 RepID=A0ABD2Q077_9PLAT